MAKDRENILKKTVFQKVAEKTRRSTKSLRRFERLVRDTPVKNEEMFKAMDEVNQRKRKEKDEEVADRKKAIKLQEKILQHNQKSAKSETKWKIIALVEAVILIILGILTLCF
jgi:hypothetical protein